MSGYYYTLYIDTNSIFSDEDLNLVLDVMNACLKRALKYPERVSSKYLIQKDSRTDTTQGVVLEFTV